MLLTSPFVRVTPRLGTRSAITHGASAMSLTADETSMRARRDVDTLDDLPASERGPAC